MLLALVALYLIFKKRDATERLYNINKFERLEGAFRVL